MRKGLDASMWAVTMPVKVFRLLTGLSAISLILSACAAPDLAPNALSSDLKDAGGLQFNEVPRALFLPGTIVSITDYNGFRPKTNFHQLPDTTWCQDNNLCGLSSMHVSTVKQPSSNTMPLPQSKAPKLLE